MREKFEYKEIEITLGSIANNPNFSDMERNWADELWTSLKNSEEPKQPTHEEIMTKWWNDQEVWMRVFEYWVDVKNPYKLSSGLNVAKEWFTNRESAIVPQESV